jgi:hypothetical protein
MSDNSQPLNSLNSTDIILLALQSQEARIAVLERPPARSFFKRLSENATAVALFLGLVLMFGSLRDTFWTKPEADRISRISQFNQAVNSAAKLRQELIQSQNQITDKGQQLLILSMATPQILNNISTATAIAHDLEDRDIGISQLIILISEAYTAGDLDSVKALVTLAVNKTDVPPFLKSEARRYEGKYLFASGNSVKARDSFQTALRDLGESPAAAASRAYVLLDLVLIEYSYGDCGHADEDLSTFASALNSPYVAVQARSQMAYGMKGQLVQLAGQRCPMPRNLDALLPL